MRAAPSTRDAARWPRQKSRAPSGRQEKKEVLVGSSSGGSKETGTGGRVRMSRRNLASVKKRLGARQALSKFEANRPSGLRMVAVAGRSQPERRAKSLLAGSSSGMVKAAPHFGQ